MTRSAAIAIVIAISGMLAPDLSHGTAAPAIAGGPFTPPPLLANTTAHYQSTQSWINYTITGPILTHDPSGQIVEAYEVASFSQFRDRVRTDSGVEVNLYQPCSSTINGVCSPLSYTTWQGVGRPGLFGATLLQGRTFEIGDTWTVESDCTRCQAPIQVAIEPPLPTSPTGTAYIANVTAAWRGHGASANWPSGSLHMSTDHPYPLRYDQRGPTATYTLQTITPGDTPIAVASPPTPAHYTPPLQAVPFDGNRPIEGIPDPGFYSWNDLRNATGPDLLDQHADAQILKLNYLFYESRLIPETRTQLLVTGRHHTFNLTVARAGQSDTYTEYDQSEQYVLGQRTSPVSWERRDAELLDATASHACPPTAIPTWDLVRHGNSLQLMHGYGGYSLRPDSLSGPCGGYTLALINIGTSFGSTQSVLFNGRTGFLMQAAVLRDPPPTLI